MPALLLLVTAQLTGPVPLPLLFQPYTLHIDQTSRSVRVPSRWPAITRHLLALTSSNCGIIAGCCLCCELLNAGTK